nr:MAG TPA_asm: hypothetical protein [Caudoviricetes sp.]
MGLYCQKVKCRRAALERESGGFCPRPLSIGCKWRNTHSRALVL